RDRFPGDGDENGNGVQYPGCPCNCERRAIAPYAIGIILIPRRRCEAALTRKPGDLPVAVVHRVDRVCQASGEFPERRQVWTAYRGGCAAGVCPLARPPGTRDVVLGARSMLNRFALIPLFIS